jgi:hypothetical protein
MLVIITSPHRKAGLAYDLWRDHYGKDDADILVVRGPSTAFNPTLNPKIIEAALARDPQAAAAEWLAEWRSDLVTFLDRELIDAAMDRDVVARPPVPGLKYFGFADMSGGAHDSSTGAIAHAEGEIVLLDALIEIRAPHNPMQATGQIAELLKSYKLAAVTGDRYAAQWVVQAFAKCGITYAASERDRSAIYLDALPLFTSGRARLLDNARLAGQFANLERRAFSTGRDRVDHPPAGHDDLCNAAAGALTRAAGVKRIPIIAPIMVGTGQGRFAELGGMTQPWRGSMPPLIPNGGYR